MARFREALMRASLFDFGDIDAITYIVQVSWLAERMHTRIDLGHPQPWGEDSNAVIQRALVRGPYGYGASIRQRALLTTSTNLRFPPEQPNSIGEK